MHHVPRRASHDTQWTGFDKSLRVIRVMFPHLFRVPPLCSLYTVLSLVLLVSPSFLLSALDGTAILGY